MPMKSMVIASSDDPYGSFEHSSRIAQVWNSRLVPVGAKGHINLGDWSEGQQLLKEFTASL